MKTWLVLWLVAVAPMAIGSEADLEIDDNEEIEHCVEDLMSFGVSQRDAFRECRAAHPYSIDMAHCSLGLVRRGVRGDHAVRECRQQGAGAYRFIGCVINLVDVHKVRTDIA